MPRVGYRPLDLTGPAALRPFPQGLVDAGRTVLVVAATVREAEDLTEELQSLLFDPAVVALYPAWETLPHEHLSPRSDTVGRRLAVLRRIDAPGG